VSRGTVRPLLAGVFLVSFSLIAYEIALSRLLSVVLSYHYVFAVLSFALLGLGLGGLLLHARNPRIPDPGEAIRRLTTLGAGLSVSIPLSAAALLWMGSAGFIAGDVLWCVPVLLIPFVLAGVLLAEVYRSFPEISPRTYGADLMGAAAGALGVILLLDSLGGIRVYVALGAAASAGALLLAAAGTREDGPRPWRMPVLGTLFSLALLGGSAAGLLTMDVNVGKNPAKEIHDALSSFGGRIIESRWSAFGRTDVVAFDEHPDHMDMYLDGTAGSPMYRFNGDLNDPGPAIRDLKDHFPGYFPFLHLREEEKKTALVIGPGGGRDILLALMGGIKRITAVEINGDLVDLVRQYASFNGGIYSDFRQVEMVVDEGRSYLRRQKERYDVVFLSLPVTNTSRSVEGFALTENYLFTTESIGEYWDHLSDEGRLIVVGHNDAEALRLIVISLKALGPRGFSGAKAMSHICLVSSGDYLAFVLRKTPFQPMEAQTLLRAMVRMGYDRGSSYIPHVGAGGGLNPALVALGAGRMGLPELVARVEERGYDIGPVSDDTPFFYKLERGIPRAVSMVLWSSVVLLSLVLGGFALRFRRDVRPREDSRSGRRKDSRQSLVRFSALFTMLGVGFMMVEISLIQRFSLLVGQPVWCLGVVLFSLLLGGGAGSTLWGGWAAERIHRRIALVGLGIAGTIMGYALLLPMLLPLPGGLSPLERLAMTALFVAPLGFILGVPFSLGVRALGRAEREGVVPWMWGVNGIGSVLGSALTIVLALHIGFTGALLASAVCYFVVFLAFVRS
jgi:hypothetical protein